MSRHRPPRRRSERTRRRPDLREPRVPKRAMERDTRPRRHVHHARLPVRGASPRERQRLLLLRMPYHQGTRPRACPHRPLCADGGRSRPNGRTHASATGRRTPAGARTGVHASTRSGAIATREADAQVRLATHEAHKPMCYFRVGRIPSHQGNREHIRTTGSPPGCLFPFTLRIHKRRHATMYTQRTELPRCFAGGGIPCGERSALSTRNAGCCFRWRTRRLLLSSLPSSSSSSDDDGQWLESSGPSVSPSSVCASPSPESSESEGAAVFCVLFLFFVFNKGLPCVLYFKSVASMVCI